MNASMSDTHNLGEHDFDRPDLYTTLIVNYSVEVGIRLARMGRHIAPQHCE